MSISANKAHGVRAALCHTEFEARLARGHNDANVLCLGQRVTGGGLAQEILKAFLVSTFEGGRHADRVAKITGAGGEAVRALSAAAVLLACACRTEIVPVVRTVEQPKVYAAPTGQCNVRDYPAATDVPTGAKNLGWVQVKRAPTDEESYQRLREKILFAGRRRALAAGVDPRGR